MFQIRIYDLAKQQAFKCLHKFDVANEIEKWSTNSPEYITSGMMLYHSPKKNKKYSYIVLALTGGALICSHPQQQCSSVTPNAHAV